MAATREQFLAAKPIRSPEASAESINDGGIRISIPVKRMWWFKLPANSIKKFELDEVGKFVWEKCDGKTSLQSIIKQVSQQYRLNIREAEVSTLKFFEMLSRKRLVGVAAKAMEK